MDFANIKLSDITGVVRFTPKVKKWYSANKTHIIGLQLSGSALHDFGNRRMTLDEDCIYFLNQNEPYHVELDEPGEAFSIHFTAYEPIDTPSFCIKTESKGEVIRQLERIENLFLKGRHDNELSMHFYRLCSLFDELRSKGYSRKNDVIQACRDYIDLHFRENDCLKVASSLSNVSRRRFNELFKRSFDITPNNYLITRKIEYAKGLLLSGSISVSDISELCGFSDVYYFSKVFKAHAGVSPSQFSKSQGQQ